MIRFKIHNAVRQGFAISPWLFNMHVDRVDGSEISRGGKRMDIT